jgi:hypothetical protein
VISLVYFTALLGDGAVDNSQWASGELLRLTSAVSTSNSIALLVLSNPFVAYLEMLRSSQEVFTVSLKGHCLNGLSGIQFNMDRVVLPHLQSFDCSCVVAGREASELNPEPHQAPCLCVHEHKALQMKIEALSMTGAQLTLKKQSRCCCQDLFYPSANPVREQGPVIFSESMLIKYYTVR